MANVLVVGFDGATFDIIRPLIKQGRLPTLESMLADGAHGQLESTTPPATPAAWTTFFTGKNPGKHGIYDFQRLDPATYEMTSMRTEEHSEKTIWDLLGENGHRCIVLDVPFTYPPRPLNGLMITGYGTPRTPDSTFTYPADLAERVPQSLRSEVRVALPTHKFDRSRAFIEEWREIMRGRQKLLQYMITEEEWDLFTVVFSITDTMAHVFWTYVDPAHPNYYRSEAEEYREAFFGAYETCDRLLGELMQNAGDDTTTLVLSDHGFGSVRPRQYVFRRLLDGGYIETKKSPVFSTLGDTLMKAAVHLYTNFPVLREWAKGLRPQQRKTVKNTLKSAGMMPTMESIDFSRSKIIPASFGLRMWVNDTSRFGQGCVPPDQKDALLGELRAFLEADRDPVYDEPIIAATYRPNQLYHGPFASQAPDLVVEYSNLFYPDTPHRGKNPHIEGGHTQYGIFLAHGPSIKTTVVEQAGLIDLAPTILHLLDHPIPPDMDGRVLTEIHSDEFLEQQPVRAGDTPATLDSAPATLGSGYTADEDAEIKRQLRQLGYIE